MLTTVVGSFPHKLYSPSTFSEKIKNTLGQFDPYKKTIRDIVFDELKAGVDIVADGGVREMNMINYFSRYMPGMKIDGKTTVIKSKILSPHTDITINDINTACDAIWEYKRLHNIPDEEFKNKAVKGVVTGPSTMVYSSMIESFYKNKSDAVLDYAKAFNRELLAIEKKTPAVYIQIDEPILSTGIADLDVAKEAIDIMTEGVKIPIAVHSCGSVKDTYRYLAKFNVDMLDFEFAGNHDNFVTIKHNKSKFKDKIIGFGCVDSAIDQVDDKYRTRELMHKAVDVFGEDNLIFDPDCGLGKLSHDNAFRKLELMCNLNNEFDD
ncbi:methionine synthase [Methanobrevibacter boviskoreani]|uniref:methionine synthase n=1 Tax=Methanobrevibacter boviskoreani TaxID=1348249 RepID=UPI0023F3F168|nr:methionine synthase [Methanobrevibacter boviskoreani]MDD6257167.1 methionine synthase [Methanobrevibacter boviskoreani]